MLAAGLPVLEVTLRHPCAIDAIAAIARHCPDAIVGAGTVLTGDDLARVRDAGAAFAISPGATPTLYAAAVRVELAAPSGATWTFGPDDAEQSVVGAAVDFCLVVTQCRHVDATGLVVTGGDARDWMAKAQACDSAKPKLAKDRILT